MHPLSRPGVTEDNLKTFIGNNAEKIIRRGSKDISWCWPAFFFGFLWLAYRKAYLAAIVVLVVEFAVQTFAIFSYFSGFTAGFGLHFHYPVLLISLLMGLFGMRYYLSFASKKVAKINAETADPAARDSLYHAKGRTSALSLVVFLVLGVILNVGIFCGLGGYEQMRQVVIQSETTQTENAQVTTVTVQNAHTSVHSVITTSTKVSTNTAS